MVKERREGERGMEWDGEEWEGERGERGEHKNLVNEHRRGSSQLSSQAAS